MIDDSASESQSDLSVDQGQPSEVNSPSKHTPNDTNEILVLHPEFVSTGNAQNFHCDVYDDIYEAIHKDAAPSSERDLRDVCFIRRHKCRKFSRSDVWTSE